MNLKRVERDGTKMEYSTDTNSRGQFTACINVARVSYIKVLFATLDRTCLPLANRKIGEEVIILSEKRTMSRQYVKQLYNTRV